MVNVKAIKLNKLLLHAAVKGALTSDWYLGGGGGVIFECIGAYCGPWCVSVFVSAVDVTKFDEVLQRRQLDFFFCWPRRSSTSEYGNIWRLCSARSTTQTSSPPLSSTTNLHTHLRLRVTFFFLSSSSFWIVGFRRNNDCPTWLLFFCSIHRRSRCFYDWNEVGWQRRNNHGRWIIQLILFFSYVAVKRIRRANWRVFGRHCLRLSFFFFKLLSNLSQIWSGMNFQSVQKKKNLFEND